MSTPQPSYHTRIGVSHVNWLIQLCGMNELYPIYDMSECSSSLFVVLIQRLLHYRLSGLELEPDTNDKKLTNMGRVLEELQLITQVDLSYISPAEIVAGNREHISMLVHVFLFLAEYQPNEEVRDDGSHMVHGHYHNRQGEEGYTMDEADTAAGHSHQSRPLRADDEEGAAVHHHHQHASDQDDGLNRVYSVPPPPPRGGYVPDAEVVPSAAAAAVVNAGKEQPTAAGANTNETASSVSNADSANFTNQLVHDWKLHVVDAVPRPFGAGIDRLTLANVKQRLDSLEKAVTSRQADRRARPTAHDSRSRVVESFVDRLHTSRGGGGDVASGRVTAVISRAQRDERTAAIRAVKVHRALQDEVRREIVKARSVMEQRALEDLKENLKAQRRDCVDAKRRVRGESDDLFRTLSHKIASIANDPKLHSGSAVTLKNQNLLSVTTRHMVREHAGAVRETKRMAKQYRKDSRDQLNAELRSYTRLHGALFAVSPEDIV